MAIIMAQCGPEYYHSVPRCLLPLNLAQFSTHSLCTGTLLLAQHMTQPRRTRSNDIVLGLWKGSATQLNTTHLT